MPKLNRILVTSIIADIRECVCVTGEIYSWVGKIEHLSWKFPTKTAKDINAMEIVEEHKGTAGEFYILLLELAYDRIHFFLRLVVEFMDKYPFVEDFLEETRGVVREGQMSLGTLLRLIWNRLKTIPESISRYLVEKTKEEDFPRKMSRSCQTDGGPRYCASCATAGQAILAVTNTIGRVFEENKLICATVAERERTREDIYKTSQWAAMRRLTMAIGVDVESIVSTMRENASRLELARRDHAMEILDLRADLSRENERMDSFRAKNVELRGMLENAEERLAAAERANFAMEERNRLLNETLENVREWASLLADGNNILQSQVGTLAGNKLELENTVSRLQKELAGTRDACSQAERGFRLLLTELKEENDATKGEYERKIEALREEISVMRVAEEDKKVGKKKVGATGAGPANKGPREETILMPGDDPTVDMTRQLISNREKIEVLSRQNERLSKTLSRLREYRQTTTNGLDK